MAILERIKYEGAGAECEVCKRDAHPGETRCPNCSKPFVTRPWLAYKWPSEDLVLGSQLIVNKSQEAIFYKGGRPHDVFGEGRHTLKSANLPLLRRVVNFPFGRKTPFSAEIYFVNKVAKLDMKWGTTDRFQVMDPMLQLPVRVGGFGRFGIRISDARNFVTQIVGTLHDNNLSDYQTVSRYFKGLVITKVKDTIGEAIVKRNVGVMEIMASIDSMSNTCRDRIASEFDRFGIEVLNFFIESINLPPEDMEMIRDLWRDKREIELLGDKYNVKRLFDALEKVAAGEGTGGPMGAGMGMGMGFGAGAAMGGTLGKLVEQAKVAPAESEGEHKVACPKCGFQNKSTAKFCNDCAAQLVTRPVVCPSCKKENEPGWKFCNGCGASLQSIKCPKCNFENQPGSKFCSGCSNKLEE